MQNNEYFEIFKNVVTNPINAGLLMVCFYLIYKICRPSKNELSPGPTPEPELPPLKKKDLTVLELREYDGIKNNGRILMAVNGNIFDVTRGKKFYGPDGPYGVFAGRDATRGLAQFRLDKDAIKEGYDDISDLNEMEMDSVREWEMQFAEKYEFVGRLLKPGEESTDYSDQSETEEKGCAKKVKKGKSKEE